MRKRIAFGVPVCALALVTGCQSGDSGDKAAPAGANSGTAAAVRAAAGATAQAGSSRTRTTMTMQSGSRSVTLNGQGLFDYTRRVGSLTLQVPKEAARGAGGPLEEVITADALYLKNADSQVPKGKWVRVDVAGLADGNLVSGGSTDPATSFEMLRGAGNDTTLVGNEQLDGVRVRHYKGTLDLKKAYDSAPQEQRATLAAALRSFASSKIPFEAWLDDTGRLRKVQEEFALASQSAKAKGGGSAAQAARIVSAAELYDFGVAVTVQPPNPRDVYTPGPTASSGPASAVPTSAPAGPKPHQP